MTYDRSDFAEIETDERTDAVRSRIVSHVASTVDDAGANGVVVAMSGGIDSTVTAALAVEALGSERVLGLGLPCHKTEASDVSDARTIADGLGIDFREVHLRPLTEMFEGTVAPAIEPEGATEPDVDRHAIGNLVARLRMCCAYYVANRFSRLVLGTANRSELLLGYFTKYGDGAADCYPIGDLYKTEVRTLARDLGIPRRIVAKDPTAGFWAGQTDAGELGAPYDVIDPLLVRLVDRGQQVETAADELDVDLAVARDVATMYLETMHKRETPPTPGIGERDRNRALYSRYLGDLE